MRHRVAEVRTGTGKLTGSLLARGPEVDPIEPAVHAGEVRSPKKVPFHERGEAAFYIAGREPVDCDQLLS